MSWISESFGANNRKIPDRLLDMVLLHHSIPLLTLLACSEVIGGAAASLQRSV